MALFQVLTHESSQQSYTQSTFSMREVTIISHFTDEETKVQHVKRFKPNK